MENPTYIFVGHVPELPGILVWSTSGIDRRQNLGAGQPPGGFAAEDRDYHLTVKYANSSEKGQIAQIPWPRDAQLHI